MKFAKLLTAFIALFGAVKKLVVDIERPGFGAEKKALIMEVLDALLETSEVFIDVPKDLLLKAADKLIDLLVAFYNLTGVFTHK